MTASALRDLEFNDDPYRPYWGEGHTELGKPSKAAKGGTLAALLIVCLGCLVGARFWGLRNEPAPQTKPEPRSDVSRWLEKHIPGAPPVHVKADIRSGLKDWVGDSHGWRVEGSRIRPGRLRLWKPTLNARDYEFSFDATIDQRAVAWAYRAADLKNYYAAKIVVSRPGVPSGASLLRYGVVDGKLHSMTALPLPRPLDRNRPYSIALQARGDNFRTLVDGVQVDDWSDDRLAAGGVGLFADPGEQSAVSAIEFKEMRGWMGGFPTALLMFGPAY